MQLPDFCDLSQAENWSYRANHTTLFNDAIHYKRRFRIPEISKDQPNITLLLIDVQKDFVHKEGSLYVGGRSGQGAIEDTKRITSFIYNNLSNIKNIYASYDTHLALQIFFPTFWVDSDGLPIQPHTTILALDILNGKYFPAPSVKHLCHNDASYLNKLVTNYCERLEKSGNYYLYIWPFHCIVGSDGHGLNGLLHEACLFHSFVRGAQTNYELKGTNPWSENYSVFSPEVIFDHEGTTIGHRNDQLFNKLFKSDALIIAGQAISHCVKSSVDDLIQETKSRMPGFLSKIYILEDCMSSVVVPGVVDFTEQAEKSLEKYRQLGINVIKSTVPIKEWPGISPPL